MGWFFLLLRGNHPAFFQQTNKEIKMKTYNQILGALGEILIEIRKLSERVTKLEISQAWLEAGWFFLIAVWIFSIQLALVKP
jgi:hypothetical protein